MSSSSESAASVPDLSLPCWPRAHGEDLAAALIRVQVDDFIVEEIPRHEPTGSGEHLWLQVEKRAANTAWVARQLARWAGIPARGVSYAGLKDRHAVTRQCFSLHLPGQADPDPSTLADFSRGDFSILGQQRSARKLQRGALAGNRFQIRLRECSASLEQLQDRLQRISREGVPNYFGEQRFGHDNLAQALRCVVAERKPPRDRDLRALYFSVLRSYLFNRLLAQRVGDGSWQRILPDERVMLAGSHSWFSAVGECLETLQQRCGQGDIHPTAALAGMDSSSHPVPAWEAESLAPYADWLAALNHFKLEAQRRPLRLMAAGLQLSEREGDPVLHFELPAGAYATALLREIVDYRVADLAWGSDGE